MAIDATRRNRTRQKRRGEGVADFLRRRGASGMGAESEGSSDILGRRRKKKGGKRKLWSKGDKEGGRRFELTFWKGG